MRHVIVLLLLSSACVASEAFADEASYGPATEAHRPGRLSLQFEIGQNFRIMGYGGAGLAITKNTSPGAAWRLGFRVNAETTDQESNSDFSTNDYPEDEVHLNLEVLRLKRFHPSRRFGLELGAGPFVSYDSRHSELNTTYPDSTFEGAQSVRSTFLGAGAQLGVEAMVVRSISVHAHYGASLGYRHQSNEGSRTTTSPIAGTEERAEERTTSGWLLQENGVRFGVSLYF